MTDPREPDVLDLRDYLAVLRRRRWLIALVVLATLAAAMLVTLLQTPMYEAETRLVVTPAGSASDDQILRDIVMGDRQLQTQRELVTSVAVARRVIDQLGLTIEPADLIEQVSADSLRDTEILTIRATDADAAQSAALSRGFAEAYLNYRRDQALERAITASQELEGRTETIRDRITEIDRELARSSTAEQSALEGERAALLAQLGQVSAQLSSLQATDTFVRGGGEIIQPAEVPDSPASPRPLRTGVLALVLGLMLGVGLAFLRDFLDDVIRTDDQAIRASGQPVLGHVPRFETKAARSRSVALTEPTSPAAEAYRTLRTNLKFLSVSDPIRTLLVTSAQPGDGKTTTAANLAVAAAGAGDRVILVGADMRKPTVHRMFGMGAGPGLSDLLVGELPLATAIRDISVANLRIIPTGAIPPNPTELLASPRMAGLIDQLSELADLIIVDAPPILGLADTLELIPRVGGVLLVLDAGSTGRHAVRVASDRIAGVGGRLAGTVLNRVDTSADSYGYYYTAYGYLEDEPRPQGLLGRLRRRTGTAA